jgi:hypothetical protein
VDQYGAQLGLDASLLQCTLRRMSRADERQAQVVLAHMAEVWLRLADRYQDVGKRQPTFSSNSRCSLRKIGRPAQYPPSGNKDPDVPAYVGSWQILLQNSVASFFGG